MMAVQGRVLNSTREISDIAPAPRAPRNALADPADNIDRLDVLAVARAAGLHKAVERFPDCVADAARAAAADLADMPPIDGAAEPWPPMAVRRDR